ncbi:zinc-ribbon domain-containing protein [Streptomyces monticola]|uniref:Zinc-ribbon domain-containing protein n=1 Tax=Streptomyces monticola TaxID=2666263 RepID=A0ABW2JCX8_9ACTN
MIIFGTKGYVYQLAMLTLVCGNCGNPAAHSLRKHVTKFTLFFVPLLPISTSYRTQCTFCGTEHKVPKDQADGMIAQGTGTGQQNQGAYAPPQQGQSHGNNPYQ